MSDAAQRGFANVVGFDDAPFDRAHRGDVAVFGAVYAGQPWPRVSVPLGPGRGRRKARSNR